MDGKKDARGTRGANVLRRVINLNHESGPRRQKFQGGTWVPSDCSEGIEMNLGCMEAQIFRTA